MKAQTLIIFLLINFLALGICSALSGDGATSVWYSHQNQAPWTPPGWVFGVAWTSIMICFSIYMSYLLSTESTKKFVILSFAAQWILNVSWSPVFFKYQNAMAGLVIISLLTLAVTFMLFKNIKSLHVKSVFILPYFLWLLIATSLNAYILFNN